MTKYRVKAGMHIIKDDVRGEGSIFELESATFADSPERAPFFEKVIESVVEDPDKLAAEKAEADKLAAEKAEADKLAAEKAEADKLAAKEAKAREKAEQKAAAKAAKAEAKAAAKASKADAPPTL